MLKFWKIQEYFEKFLISHIDGATIIDYYDIFQIDAIDGVLRNCKLEGLALCFEEFNTPRKRLDLFKYYFVEFFRRFITVDAKWISQSKQWLRQDKITTEILKRLQFREIFVLWCLWTTWKKSGPSLVGIIENKSKCASVFPLSILELVQPPS